MTDIPCVQARLDTLVAVAATPFPEPDPDPTMFVIVVNTDRVKTPGAGAIWSMRAIEAVRPHRREILFAANVKSIQATQSQMLSILTECLISDVNIAVSADAVNGATVPVVALVGPARSVGGLLAELIDAHEKVTVHGRR